MTKLDKVFESSGGDPMWVAVLIVFIVGTFAWSLGVTARRADSEADRLYKQMVNLDEER